MLTPQLRGNYFWFQCCMLTTGSSLCISVLGMYHLATYKFIYILPTKYPGLDELNLIEFTLHLKACLSSDLVTGFTSPSFATIAKSVLRTKLHSI